jgi:hypothetical protein
MRAFALAAAAALSILSSTVAGAWTAEQGAAGTDGASFADPEDKLKELQDKVNSKSQPSSGFFISGGPAFTSGSNSQYLNPGFQDSGSAVVPAPYAAYVSPYRR